MTQISPIIEIHYYSSGLRTKHIGPQLRPEWLPSSEIVGPRDVQLDNNDYVIELSRHESDNKLITWIGVWLKGVDQTGGDRGANYIGLGVWLIDVLPIESHLIVDGLVKICDLLVKTGNPTDKVNSLCNRLLTEHMQKWTKDINGLPLVDRGLVFQKNDYPQTIYIKSKDSDVQKAIIAISESISINCVNAAADFKDKSQILYLILSQGSKADSTKEIKEISNNPDIFNMLYEYVSFVNKCNKDKNAGLERDVAKLTIENQNKANQNNENIIELNTSPQELTEELNKNIVKLSKQIEQQSATTKVTLTAPPASQYTQGRRQTKALRSPIVTQTSTFSRYSSLIFIGIVLALIAVIGYRVYPVVSHDEIKVIDAIQVQPQSRNINIDDIKELNSKLDNISSTVSSIENKIESSILVKETKIISPISFDQAPSNSGMIGDSKVSKNNKKSK